MPFAYFPHLCNKSMSIVLQRLDEKFDNQSQEYMNHREYCCHSGKLWYLQHNCVGDTIVYN